LSKLVKGKSVGNTVVIFTMLTKILREKVKMEKNGDPERLFEEGNKYIDAKEFDKALERFDNILELKKNHFWALYRKAFCLRQLHKYKKAQDVLDEALKLHHGKKRLLNEQGLLYYYQGEYEKAINTFEKILEKDKKNEFALRWKIILLRKLPRFKEAENVVKEALERLPESVGILEQLGRLYYYQGKYDKAIEVFDKILKSDPDNKFVLQTKISSLRRQCHFKEAENIVKEDLERLPDKAAILNWWGLIYLDQRQYDRAIEKFDEALKNDEKNEFAYQMKINSLRKKRHFKEAENIVKEALEKVEIKAGIFSHYGLLYFDQDQFDNANKFFDKAINLNPYLTYPYIDRVRVLIRTNRSHEARKTLQQLKQYFSTNLEVREQIGWFYISLNDPKNAEEEFKFILDNVAENVLGINGLGGVCFSQGRYEAAEENFRKVIDIEPHHQAFHANLAWALVRQESADLSEAEKHCIKALELDPKYAPAFGCLGIIEFKRGNLRKSENYLRTSIDVNPKKGSYTDLGALHVQMGRFEEAEENLKKAIKINYEDTQAHIELGNLYLETEELRKAIQEFRQAVAIDPESSEPPRALAIALMQTGKFSEAEKVLRNATRRLDKFKRWQLHLTLSQLFMHLGDETDDLQFYEDALKEVVKAMKLKPNHPDPHFHKGIIQAKLKDYKGARKSFHLCLKKDKDNQYFEAGRNLQRIESFLRKKRVRFISGLVGRMCVGIISLVHLIMIWALYYFGKDKITKEMVMVLVPIFLGLIALATLSPWLTRIKLPGFEAELRPPAEMISSGPVGEIGFGKSALVISQGPY